ncbi:unnamed protein product [Calypogeia fissa]
MARVAGEARECEKQWTVFFTARGVQHNLRTSGHFAGHDTKAGLKARIIEQHGRLNADNGEDNVVNLGSYLTSGAPPPDSISKTGVEFRNYNSSGLSGRSSATRGLITSPPLSPSPEPAAPALLSGGRGRKNNSPVVKDLRLSRVRDGILGRELEDFRDSPQVFPTSAAENHNKRRKFAAEQQLLPLPSPNVGVRGFLPSAADATTRPLSGEAFAISPYMDDEESDSSLDFFPSPSYEVDNFIIHAGDKFVSITALPVCIDGVLSGGTSTSGKVFLVGIVGPKSRPIMFKHRVEMWRLVLDPPQRPQYFLKTAEGEWVRLLKAREEYRKLMNDILALGHFLNFVKKLPNASPSAAEEELQKMCRNSKPQLDRLSRYNKVIRSFIDKDKEFGRASIVQKIFPHLFPKRSFAKRSSPQTDEEFEMEERRDLGVKRKAGRLPLMSESTERKEKRYKVMAKRFVQKPKLLKPSTPDLQSEYDSDYEFQKLKASRRAKRKAIDGKRFRSHGDDSSGPDYQPQIDVRRSDPHRKLFSPAEVNVEDPPICIICDDGGDLVYCDGPCRRHFHPTKRSGVDSFCKTLGMTEAEVEASDKFYCPNCKHNQQQCFICGELGSSVRTSDGPPEVRRCDVAFCNRFFHADCAAELLFAPGIDWRDFADAINDGNQQLFCPRHCCSVCGNAEMEEPGMLVQCRRCPKAWHRACLTNFSWSSQKPSVRIWKQHDREFIYCKDHKIVPKTQTPVRDHLRFPAAK